MNTQERSKKRIEDRVRGRKTAKELHELLGDMDETESKEYFEALIEELSKLLGITLVQQSKDSVTSQVPINVSGAYPLTFGKHVGKTLDEIPTDYLDWLCREYEAGQHTGSYTYKMLSSYLRHPDFESRRRGLHG